jgi:hypothetical protein
MDKCENCKFYKPDENDNSFGECRRHPPQVIEKDECYDYTHNRYRRISVTKFPFVLLDEYCGEYKAKGN